LFNNILQEQAKEEREKAEAEAREKEKLAEGKDGKGKDKGKDKGKCNICYANTLTYSGGAVDTAIVIVNMNTCV
jgi:hypothetical protein